MSGNIIQKITQIKENYILCQKMYIQYVCLSMYMSVCVCVCPSVCVCLSLMLLGVWVSVGHRRRRQWSCPATAGQHHHHCHCCCDGVGAALIAVTSCGLVQSYTWPWERCVCRGTAFQRDFGPGVAGGTYWVCRSCWWFQLMQVGVVGGRRRGCEQQQVAGVCEKAAAPVVIYTYRRAIV